MKIPHDEWKMDKITDIWFKITNISILMYILCCLITRNIFQKWKKLFSNLCVVFFCLRACYFNYIKLISEVQIEYVKKMSRRKIKTIWIYLNNKLSVWNEKKTLYCCFSTKHFDKIDGKNFITFPLIHFCFCSEECAQTILEFNLYPLYIFMAEEKIQHNIPLAKWKKNRFAVSPELVNVLPAWTGQWTPLTFNRTFDPQLTIYVLASTWFSMGFFFGAVNAIQGEKHQQWILSRFFTYIRGSQVILNAFFNSCFDSTLFKQKRK